MYLHHLQSDWVFFNARTLEGLSLSMLVLSQQFMPLIGNHHMSFCHRFHRQQVCQLCKWLWQQKSEFWMGASWRLFGIQTKRSTHHTLMPGTPLRSSSLLKFVNSFVHRMDYIVECTKVVDRFCLSKMKKETQDCWPCCFERGLVW